MSQLVFDPVAGIQNDPPPILHKIRELRQCHHVRQNWPGSSGLFGGSRDFRHRPIQPFLLGSVGNWQRGFPKMIHRKPDKQGHDDNGRTD